MEAVGATTRAARKPYEAVWWKQPLLVAAIEIGNSTKHFVLRDLNTGTPKTVQTKTARMKKTKFVNIFADGAGALHLAEVQKSEVTVTLSDSKRLLLHEFTRALLDYWKKFLASIGIKVRRQTFAQLSSSAA